MWTIQYLIEHGGANLSEVRNDGKDCWDLLLATFPWKKCDVSALLRVMVLRMAPPPALAAKLRPEHAWIIKEGARLRAGIPAYLAGRRALLAAHLIGPLQAIVSGYVLHY
jgi:hypothetical protein